MRGAAVRTVRSRIGHLVVAAAVGAGVALGSAAPAAADPSDASEGRGQLLSTDLVGIDLLDAFTAESGNPSGPGPDTADVDVAALDALLTVELPGIGVPLIASGGNGGVLDLGEAAGLGLLNSYSSSPDATSSVAASGALGADGALDVDAGSDPSTIGSTNLDLTSLLDQLGVAGLTDDVVDQLTIDLGALASRAGATGVGTAVHNYLLAGGRLTIHSPAVDELAAGLTTTIQGAEDTVNAALANGGVLDTVLDAVNIGVGIPGVAQVAAGPATATLDVDLSGVTSDLLDEELVSADGIVTINLGDGTIEVDLAKLLKGPAATDLNGLDPNTDVLTATTIDAIGAGIAEALGGLGETVGTTVRDAIDGTALNISVPGQVTLPLGAPTPLSITVAGTLGQFVGGGTPPTVTIGAGLPGAVQALLETAVQTLVVAPVGGVVDTLLDTATTGLTPAVKTLVSTATTALAPLLDVVLPGIVDITINEQTEDEVLGEDSATVRALAIDLLPVLGTIAPVNLAESTVRVSDVPTLSATPDPVYPGGTLAVTGGGWAPGTTVDLVYTDDGGTVVATSDDVAVEADGTLTDSVDLPDDVAVGDLTVTGTASDGLTATATVEVVDEPTLTATPDPVRQGGSVTVDGTGWPAGEVQLSYTDDDGTEVDLPAATVGADGVLSATFDLPDDVPLGDLVVTGTGAAGADASDTIGVVAEPSVSASPDPVTYGGTVTATGEAWTPGSQVTVTFTDANATVLQTSSVDVEDDGTFSETFEVPPGTAVGDLTITAIQGADTDSDVVQVEADPAVTASPDPARPGDTVTLDGSGYPGGVDVTVTWTDPDGTVTTHTVTTEDDGTFEDTLDLPDGVSAGDLAIGAETADGIGDDTVVDVVVPAIDVSPDPVGYGDDVTVTGSDWPAGETVTVVLTDAGGATVGSEDVAVEDDGTFSTSITVPPGTTVGAADVTATDGAGHEATGSTTIEAAPVLEASPDPVRPGDTVTVEGSGYPGGVDVTVTYTDADGTAVEQTVTTEDDGTFTDTFDVPEGTPAGALDVAAETADGIGDDTSVDVVVPSVTASPDPVAYGDDLTVTGEGWPAGETVTVVVTDQDGNEVGSEDVTVEDDGTFSTSITVPPGTALGEASISASDGAGHEATDTAEVEADPQLDVSPGVVEPGDTVTVEGSGYPPNTEVEVVYTDADGNVVDTHTVTTDEDGGFTDTLEVPDGTPPGDLTVVADDGAGNSAEGATTVAEPDADGPTIVAGPPTVEPGDTVTVEGSGYPPNTEVEVVYTDADGNVIDTHTVTTDENGDFTDTLEVPEGTPPGELTIVADDGDGNSAGDSVTVVEVGAGDGSGDGSGGGGDGGATAPGDGSIPDTGAPVPAGLLGLAVALVALGAAALALGRRRDDTV